MANDVTAVFRGDIGPMEKAMAQLRAAMKATAASGAKDLTFKPRVDETALKAATANIAAHMKQMQSGAAFKPVLPAPRDFSASNAELDRAFSRVQTPINAGRAGGKRGGAGAGDGMRNFQTTNAAAQLQDIAVQMQMGTRMTTIFAQQVPQLLSAFGPSAAILGGAAALGGLLLTVGDNAKRAFDGMIQGAADSNEEIGKLVKSGGVGELSAAMVRLEQQTAQFDQQRKQNDSIGGKLVGGLGMLMGGDSAFEQETKMIIAQTQAGQLKLDAQKRLKEASEEELKIAILRSKGYDEEADGMERNIALKRTLASIDASIGDQDTKDLLKRNATTKAAVEAETAKNAKTLKQAEESRLKEMNLAKSIQDQREGLAADRLGGKTGAERLMGLEELQKQRRNDAVMGGLSLDQGGIDAMLKGGDLAKAEKSLKLLREYEATQRELDELSRSMREAAAGESADKEERGVAQKKAVDEARNFFAVEMQISAAIATSGMREDAKVKALQEGLEVLRLQKQLMDQLGLSAEEALQTATLKMNLEKEAAESVKRTQQQNNLQDIQAKAEINHARAHGHTRKAEVMESRAAEAAKAKELMDNGMAPNKATKLAEIMQRDEDKIAGRKIRSRNNAGKDMVAYGFKGFDFKSDAVPGSMPGLAAMAKAQAGANAQKAARGMEGKTDTLLEMVVKGLSAIENKLNFVN